MSATALTHTAVLTHNKPQIHFSLSNVLNVLSRRRAQSDITDGFQRQKCLMVDTLCSGVTYHINIVTVRKSVMTQVNKSPLSVLLLHMTAQKY
jgi:hypothetical protein